MTSFALRPWQILVCFLLASAFWLLATLYIHLLPRAVTSPLQGTIGFATGFPVGLLCVWLTSRLARLAPAQIPVACLVVLGDAMLLDGVALRWFHHLYAADERTARLGAAWLLWGYGASAYAALLLAQWRGARIVARAA